MKPRKIPTRKCVVTKEMFPKKQLLRVVLNKEGDVFFDRSGKANGRGAYVVNKESVILKAKKNKIIDKVLGVEIPESVYDALYEYAETHI